MELNLSEKNINLKDLQLIIPEGPYCYFGSRNPSDNNYKPCPFWDLVGKDNEFGYCSYLERGDDSEVSTLCLSTDLKPSDTEIAFTTHSNLVLERPPLA